MKRFLIALSVLVLFFIGIFAIAYFRGPWKPTEKAEQMMVEIEESYSNLLSKMPAARSEVEFFPDTPLENIGFSDHQSGYQVHICQEEELKEIANGTYNVDELEASGHNSLSSGQWCFLDLEYAKEKKSYLDYEHEDDIRLIQGINHVGVFRTEDRYNGKWEGDYILERAWFKGWFFLWDVKSAELLGCKRLDINGGEEAWDWEGDGIDPLVDDLNNRVVARANTYVNEWCETEGWGYFNFFHPEELD